MEPIRNFYGQKNSARNSNLDHVEVMHVSVDHSQSRTHRIACISGVRARRGPGTGRQGQMDRKDSHQTRGQGRAWPKGRGTWDKPALLEKDLVFDITGQEGRRFWGVTTVSGGGE